MHGHAAYAPHALNHAHRGVDAARVKARNLVPTLSHYTSLEGAFHLALEHPFRIDSLPSSGHGRARNKLVHLTVFKTCDLVFCCCVPLGGFGRGPRFLDCPWNIWLRCSHSVHVLREAECAVPVGDVEKLSLHGKRVGEVTKLADGLCSGYARRRPGGCRRRRGSSSTTSTTSTCRPVATSTALRDASPRRSTTRSRPGDCRLRCGTSYTTRRTAFTHRATLRRSTRWSRTSGR